MSTELPKSVKIGEQVFNMPWVSFVPRPSEEEEATIQAAIAENGVYPPLCWKDKDGSLSVIDGHTRLLVAAKLSIKSVPFTLFNGTREEAEIAAVAANAVHRDWTRETRLATVKELFGQKWPQRKIARALGVNPGQVHYDLIFLKLIEAPTPPAPAPKPAPEQPAPTPAPAAPEAAKPTPAGPAPAWTDAPKPTATPAAPAADAKPNPPSVADRRAAGIDRAKTLVQQLTKVTSELEIYVKCEEALEKLIDVIDKFAKGK